MKLKNKPLTNLLLTYSLRPGRVLRHGLNTYYLKHQKVDSHLILIDFYGTPRLPWTLPLPILHVSKLASLETDL